jgi:hypothetical protein
MKRVVGFRPLPPLGRLGLLTVVALVLLLPRWSRAQAELKKRPDPLSSRQANPDPIPEGQVNVPVLRTIRERGDRQTFHNPMVDASIASQDKSGARVLDFAYKPLRVKTLDDPNKGKRQVAYLYYRVVNRTCAQRMFAPRFIMVNDKGEKFEDSVVPEAIPHIQMREGPAIRILGAEKIMGLLPPSAGPDVDDAVYGIATWEKWDRNADRFSIYVRGLSNGDIERSSPGGRKPAVKHSTLRIDFIRQGRG